MSTLNHRIRPMPASPLTLLRAALLEAVAIAPPHPAQFADSPDEELALRLIEGMRQQPQAFMFKPASLRAAPEVVIEP